MPAVVTSVVVAAVFAPFVAMPAAVFAAFMCVPAVPAPVTVAVHPSIAVRPPVRPSDRVTRSRPVPAARNPHVTRTVAVPVPVTSGPEKSGTGPGHALEPRRWRPESHGNGQARAGMGLRDGGERAQAQGQGGEQRELCGSIHASSPSSAADSRRRGNEAPTACVDRHRFPVQPGARLRNPQVAGSVAQAVEVRKTHGLSSARRCRVLRECSAARVRSAAPADTPASAPAPAARACWRAAPVRGG